MAVRKIIFFCVIGLLAVFVAVQILPARAYFMVNKAQYLMNQSEWAQAGGILEQALAIQPGNEEAKRLLAWVNMHEGNYDTARKLLGALDPSGEKEYSLGLSCYQMDEPDSAAAHFRNATVNGTRLPAIEKKIAAMAAGELSGNMSSELIPASSEDLKPLDDMLKNSIEGRLLFSRSEFTESAVRLARALEQGDRTSETLLLACAANTALGNFTNAKWYADNAYKHSDFYPALVHALTLSYDRFTSRTYSTQMAARYAELRRKLIEARLWAQLRGAEQTGTTEALEKTLDEAENLVNAKPSSLMPGILFAEALEAAGRYRDAYLQYESLYNRQPCYSLLLRMRNLAGDTPEFQAARAVYVMEFPAVCNVSAREMESTAGLLRRDHMALFNSGIVTATVEVPAQGYYMINIIARGDRADGFNPLMKIRVDQQQPEYIYIAWEGWDCYAITRFLSQGVHAVEMEFLNDNPNPDANEEDRNLYLGGLIVSKTGVY